MEQVQKLVESVEQIWQSSSGLTRSISILRWIGYALLILAAFDFITILIPPNFRNPAWELQIYGELIERVPVPLIGLGLVFLGERDDRSKWELHLLRVLSWLSLITAIVFFLMIPLNVFNTIRLDRVSNEQITTQAQQGTQVIQNIRTQLEQVSTPEQMEQLLAALNGGRAPDIQNDEQFQQAKEQLSSFVTQGETALKTQAQTTRSNQRLGLFKTSIKWSLGALIAGVLFGMIWRGTRWTRSRRKKSR
ncbi:MAG: hypothetical protein HC769_16695 [Cyanobacteria bacterium CRU_2_1]|nr:hypothetical protein [Cyanobacteria bacterium RU_5_0]NJR60318.1 hypothetical protein [Cyanobacteria bacterium CRU_2_1]